MAAANSVTDWTAGSGELTSGDSHGSGLALTNRRGGVGGTVTAVWKLFFLIYTFFIAHAFICAADKRAALRWKSKFFQRFWTNGELLLQRKREIIQCLL